MTRACFTLGDSRSSHRMHVGRSAILQAGFGLLTACAIVVMTGTSHAADPAATPSGAVVTPVGVYDASRSGIVGDGATLNTAAIQNAIDAISQAGGGRLVFPAPGTYLTGTICLKDNVTLDIQVGATLLGSQQYADYREDVGMCTYPEGIDRCLIYANNARNIGLTGRGTINGNGKPRHLLESKTIQRPMLVRFESCRGVQVDQLTLTECFSWCFHFVRCKDLHINGLSIFNRRQDGIDLESCENATVSDCIIDSGDDAIVLLTDRNLPTRNIVITNCILKSQWAGVRFGPLSYGDISNITVSNCVIRDCHGGGIKIAMLGGGTIRHGTFSNLSFDKVVAPVVVFLTDWEQVGANPRHMLPLGRISHLSFSHITGTACTGNRSIPDSSATIYLHGHPKQDLEDISLSDIDLTMDGGGTEQEAANRDLTDADRMAHGGMWIEHHQWGAPPASSLYARHVTGLSLDRVHFTISNPDARSTVFVSQSRDVSIAGLTASDPRPGAAARVSLLDCQGVLISGCLDRRGGANFLSLEGAHTTGIHCFGNGLSGFTELVRRGAEVPETAVHSN